MNLHVTSPGLTAGAFAIAKYKDNVTSILLNDSALTMTSPLVFPGYFFTEHLPGLKFSSPLDWTVNCKDASYTASSVSADSLYRVSVGTKDSVSLTASITINWTKSYSEHTSATPKVYISLIWYPSFSDSDYGTPLGGFFSGDTGIYMTSKDFLSTLNIPDYGILQVNVCRYFIDKSYHDNYTFAEINAVETGTCLYIK